MTARDPHARRGAGRRPAGAAGGQRRPKSSPAKRDAARNEKARRKATSPRRPASRLKNRRVRVAVVCGLGVVFVGFLFTFYFPTRTWLAQRRSTRAATAQLDALTNANRSLAAQAQALQDPAVVARIAREQYGMVKPGEKAYVVLPPPAAPTALPKVWPFEHSVTPTAPNTAQGEVGTSTP